MNETVAYFLRPESVQVMILGVGALLFAGTMSLWSKMKVLEKLQSIDEEDLKAVKGLQVLLVRFSNGVEKLENLTLSHEVNNAKFEMEISNIKSQMTQIDERLREVEAKIHGHMAPRPPR